MICEAIKNACFSNRSCVNDGKTQNKTTSLSKTMIQFLMFSYCHPVNHIYWQSIVFHSCWFFNRKSFQYMNVLCILWRVARAIRLYSKAKSSLKNKKQVNRWHTLNCCLNISWNLSNTQRVRPKHIAASKMCIVSSKRCIWPNFRCLFRRFMFLFDCSGSLFYRSSFFLYGEIMLMLWTRILFLFAKIWISRLFSI